MGLSDCAHSSHTLKSLEEPDCAFSGGSFLLFPRVCVGAGARGRRKRKNTLASGGAVSFLCLNGQARFRHYCSFRYGPSEHIIGHRLGDMGT